MTTIKVSYATEPGDAYDAISDPAERDRVLEKELETLKAIVRRQDAGAKAFDEHLHPRDSEGQFTEKPGGDVGASGSGVPSDMTLMERVRLLQYAGSGSDWLNAGLQGGVASAEAQELRSLIDRSTLSSEMTLYRGGSAAEFASLKVGDTFTDPFFVSTSTDPEVAGENARRAGIRSPDASPGWVMEVTAPAGTHALDVNETLGAESPLPGEHEVLLGADTAFHVDAVDADSHVVRVTIVPRRREGKGFDPSLHPRDTEGRFAEVPGAGAGQRFTTKKDALAYTSRIYRGWYDGDRNARDAMQDWENGLGYRSMQASLRGTVDELKANLSRPSERDFVDLYAAHVPKLEAAISSAPPLPEPMVVHRGIDSSLVSGLVAGDRYTDKGFTATSPYPAGAYADLPKGEQTKLEIELPAGTRAAWGPWGEMVLPPGSVFEVTRNDETGIGMRLVS